MPIEDENRPSTGRERRRGRWLPSLGSLWGRNLLGALVLAAIVGALFVIDRALSDGDLGPLDGRRPEVGEPAPAFALEDTAGSVRRLSDYRGRAVWLNFWATTCGPCRRELPEIQAIADEVGDERLVVLALNLQESGGRAEDFWDDLGLRLPILLDRDGAVAEQYRLRGLPYNFFVDEDGVLRSFKPGFLTEDEMWKRLAELGIDRSG